MTWSFHPIFDSYGVVALCGIALLLVMLTPMYRALTTGRRLMLLSLRLAVVLLTVILMLRPTTVTMTSKPQPRLYLVMFDHSRSMQLPDAKGSGTRWQQLQNLLNDAEQTLSKPGEAMEVRLLAFAKDLEPVAMGQWREMTADGEQTDLGGASDAALRQLRGKRLTGVSILSDGVQTAYDSSVDVHRAARELGRSGVPLMTVPLGPAGDATQSRDVAMENLPEQLSGFVGNDLPLTGIVKVQGYVNQPIDVQLTVEGPGAESQELGVTSVVAKQDGQLLPVQMTFAPPAVGDYKVTMRVPNQDGEMVTANNSLTCYVRVRDGLKVAYLYGTVLGEQRALRWALSTSSGVQLETRFVNPRARQQWPIDQSSLLADKTIDAFIIESVPAAAFREPDLQQLADQVAAGKGLLMLGGYYSFGPGGYQETPLADVLPVTMGKFERQDLGLEAPLSKDLHWSPEEGVRVLPVGEHPITQLAPAGKNTDVWRRLTPLLGINRLEPAKFSQVLAVAQNGLPVLVASQRGDGRVLAFAGDTTHRWWGRGSKTEHKRFWRQSVMWLVGRDAPKSDVWVSLPRRRFQPGNRVSVRGGARDDSNQEIDAEFALTLTRPDGRTQTIPLGRDGAEVVAETETLRTPGDYQIVLQATKDGRMMGTAESSFQVIDRDIELSTAAADHQQLARLAMLTKDAGGKLLQPEQWQAALQEQLSEPPSVEVDTETRWELGSTADGAWPLLLLLTLLLSLEWGLRKRWGLV